MRSVACSGLPGTEVGGTTGFPCPQKEELQMLSEREQSCKILSERIQIQDQTGFSPDMQGHSPAIPIKRKVVLGERQVLLWTSHGTPAHTGN